MDASIASILLLDGLTSGAIYALLGLATVLVFAVTRVIFIPQGEFVAYGALTLAMPARAPGHGGPPFRIPPLAAGLALGGLVGALAAA